MAIRYKLSFPNRSSRFVNVEMEVDNVDVPELVFNLAAWRPGRYELASFSKNVRSWKAFDRENNTLPFRKISKDEWQVSTEGSNKIIIKYEYYCAQPDAGACWIDVEQIYINPVHCFFFIAERISQECEITLDIPKDYRIACSLNQRGNALVASDYNELADSPFIASASLELLEYNSGGAKFNIWLQGRCKPDHDKIISDFKSFTDIQLKMMNDFPFQNYHFLIQILPYKFYHGVEHLESTVLAIGPGEQLMTKLYPELLGVASHELFHSWNVKKIRPADLHPYDYTQENYSRLGFVYEGVTTYYGDLFLARAGLFTIRQFFSEISYRLQKHFDNPGRFNLSVADSSFDTWIDGYSAGIPGRKTSIYDEGCITAIMTDLLIRKKTNSKQSLDSVMRILYDDFGKKNIGYTEHDYLSIVGNVAGESFADFFLDHIYGTEDIEKLLSLLLSSAGCELIRSESADDAEKYFGFKTIEKESVTYVQSVYPDSPAFLSGLAKDDEIIAVNENKIECNIREVLKMFSGEKVVLTVLTSMKELKDVALTPSTKSFYDKFSIEIKSSITENERTFLGNWLHSDGQTVSSRIENL